MNAQGQSVYYLINESMHYGKKKTGFSLVYTLQNFAYCG